MKPPRARQLLTVALAALTACSGTIDDTAPDIAPRYPAKLTVESFSVVEYQTGIDLSGPWYYAPLLVVSETGGRGGAHIVKMTFEKMNTVVCFTAALGAP